MSEQDLEGLVKTLNFGLQEEEDLKSPSSEVIDRTNELEVDNDMVLDDVIERNKNVLISSKSEIDESNFVKMETATATYPSMEMVRFEKLESGSEGERQSVGSEDGEEDDDDVDQEDSNKKYKIFMVPGDEKEFRNICRAPVGQGNTFCTNRLCWIGKHSEATKFLCMKAEIYIMKNRSVAFGKPSISSTCLHGDIVNRWKGSPRTLSDWANQFRLAVNNFNESDEGIATTAGMRKEAKFEKTAKMAQTPKRKRLKEELEIAPPTLYKGIVTELEDFDINDAKEHAHHFDEGLEILSSEMGKMSKVQQFLANLVKDTISSSNIRLADLNDEIGTKPCGLGSEFDAPDLWSTIGEVISNLTESTIKLEAEINEATNKLNSRIKAVEKNAKSRPGAEMNIQINKEITKMQNIISLVVKKTNEGFEQQSKRIKSISSSPSHTSFSPSFESRVSRLEQELSKVRAADGEAIAFNNLGFRSKDEAGAWIDLNAPKDDFGYIVDFHTAMEHLHQQITGVDSLASLGKLYKLRLKKISEGVAMTSFEVNNPRYFTATGNHVVVDTESFPTF